jgi:hypothetical protein
LVEADVAVELIEGNESLLFVDVELLLTELFSILGRDDLLLEATEESFDATEFSIIGLLDSGTITGAGATELFSILGSVEEVVLELATKLFGTADVFFVSKSAATDTSGIEFSILGRLEFNSVDESLLLSDFIEFRLDSADNSVLFILLVIDSFGSTGLATDSGAAFGAGMEAAAGAAASAFPVLLLLFANGSLIRNGLLLFPVDDIAIIIVIFHFISKRLCYYIHLEIIINLVFII